MLEHSSSLSSALVRIKDTRRTTRDPGDTTKDLGTSRDIGRAMPIVRLRVRVEVRGQYKFQVLVFSLQGGFRSGLIGRGCRRS